MILDFKIRVPREPHTQVEVAGLATGGTGFSSTRNPKALPFGHTGGNLYLVSIGFLHLAGAAADIAEMAGALPGPAAVLARDPVSN